MRQLEIPRVAGALTPLKPATQQQALRDDFTRTVFVIPKREWIDFEAES